MCSTEISARTSEDGSTEAEQETSCSLSAAGVCEAKAKEAEFSASAVMRRFIF
jgi:hypothetical protein